jgi:glycosyltransferase involved in cell wall biosynthesis
LICLNGLLFRDMKVCHDCVHAGQFVPGIVHRCYRDSLGASAAAALIVSWHKLSGTFANDIDVVIVPSEGARDELQQAGVQLRDLVVVPNTIQNEIEAGDGEGGYVAFAGRLSPEKGLSTLLAAWDYLGSAAPVLKIAGDGPLANELTRAASAHNKIEPQGWLDEPELIAMLQQAALIVIPSLVPEGYPIVLVQALACGTPILISDACSASQDIVRRGSGDSFTSGNHVALADAVTKFYAEASSLTVARKAARKQYTESHSPSVHYERLMDAYARAIERRSRTK